MIEVKTLCGDHIEDLIATIMCNAESTGIAHFCLFNGTKLVANPGDSIETVWAPWNKRMRIGSGMRPRS